MLFFAPVEQKSINDPSYTNSASNLKEESSEITTLSLDITPASPKEAMTIVANIPITATTKSSIKVTHYFDIFITSKLYHKKILTSGSKSILKLFFTFKIIF